MRRVLDAESSTSGDAALESEKAAPGIGSSVLRRSPILDAMEKSKVAAALYRLIRERAQKSPRVVAVALIAPGTWGIRADFDDGRSDYRYANGGPLETVPGGFDSWPPSPA